MYELVFVFFLLSGVLKQFALLFGLPIPDITLLGLILLFYFNFVEIYKYNFTIRFNITLKRILLIFFLIFILLLFSYYYSPSEKGKEYKIFLYLITVYTFFIPFLKKEFNFDLFFRIFIACSLVLSLIFAVYFPKLYINDYKLLENSMLSLYLTIGYLCGLIVLFLLRFNDTFIKKINIILIITFLIVLFISGARGPLLFLGLSLLVYLFLTGLHFIKYLPLLLISIIPLFFFTDYLMQDEYLLMFERSLNRFLLLFSENSGNSVNTRLVYYEVAFNSIFNDIDNFIFGLGINSFGIISTGFDKFSHPHNIFLEIFFEIGLFGFILFCIFFFIILYYFIKKDKTLIPIYIFIVLNAMKSSSYVQSRLLFGLLGILMFIIISDYIKKRSNK